MGKKLEILLVEDNLENLAVAKKFFSSQSNFNTDYATYRDEALSMLNSKKYIGVITDRSIPGINGENVHLDDGLAINYFQNQGYIIALKSSLKDISHIIYTEHGEISRYLLPIGDAFKDKEIIENTINIYLSLKNFEEFKVKFNEGLNFSVWKYLSDEKKIGSPWKWGNDQHTTKKDPESWKIALGYLKQGMNSTK